MSKSLSKSREGRNYHNSIRFNESSLVSLDDNDAFIATDLALYNNRYNRNTHVNIIGYHSFNILVYLVCISQFLHTENYRNL